jgi:hypothetical protein
VALATVIELDGLMTSTVDPGSGPPDWLVTLPDNGKLAAATKLMETSEKARAAISEADVLKTFFMV